MVRDTKGKIMPKLIKKVLFAGVALIMCLGLFSGCNDDSEKRPADLDDAMPEIWEDGYSLKQSNDDGDIAHMDLSKLAEVTIGIDDPYWELWNAGNLENIYVVEEHPTLVSDDGVLYSKSGDTLIRWPAKKTVTRPKDSIKYFAPECYAQCVSFSKDFELPDGAISIGESAFYESALTYIHVKENVKTVGRGAFVAETLKTIELSSPIIYRNFFSSRYVETVIFNEGVIQIRGDGKSPSYNYILISLTKVDFPETLEAIGDIYFPVNIAVSKYTFSDSIQFLSEFAFDTNAKFGADRHVNSNERYRKGKTEFVHSNRVINAYIDKKTVVWDKEWNEFIDSIKVTIQEYKEQDSPYEDLEVYLEALQSK
jgi:hypothetical protein